MCIVLCISSQLAPPLILQVGSAFWWSGKDPGSPSLCSEWTRGKDLGGRRCGGGMWNVNGTEGQGCAFEQQTSEPGERAGKVPMDSPGASAGWLHFLGDLRQ